MSTVRIPRPKESPLVLLVLLSILAWTAFAFLVGYFAGISSVDITPRVCPQVQGGVVLQTVNSTEGQMCVYISDKKPGQKRVRVTL